MKKNIFILPLLASFAVSGCVPVIIGGVATAGYMAAQERGAKVALKDAAIKTHIKDRLTSVRYQYLTEVEVTVLQGDVFLTGVVKSPKAKAEIERLVMGVPDVRRVYNELFSDNIYPAKQYSSDAWVVSQLKARMLGAQDIYSINYFVRVVNGTGYLIGLSESQAEKERVLHLARTTKGVRKVVDFIRIFDGDVQIMNDPKVLAAPEEVFED